MYRILYVLLNSFKKGKLLDILSKECSKLPFRRKFFILRHHGVIGAKMLSDIGCLDQEVLQVVANHHYKPEVNESKMLPIFREIDATL